MTPPESPPTAPPSSEESDFYLPTTEPAKLEKYQPVEERNANDPEAQDRKAKLEGILEKDQPLPEKIRKFLGADDFFTAARISQQNGSIPTMIPDKFFRSEKLKQEIDSLRGQLADGQGLDTIIADVTKRAEDQGDQNGLIALKVIGARLYQGNRVTRRRPWESRSPDEKLATRLAENIIIACEQEAVLLAMKQDRLKPKTALNFAKIFNQYEKNVDVADTTRSYLSMTVDQLKDFITERAPSLLTPSAKEVQPPTPAPIPETAGKVSERPTPAPEKPKPETVLPPQSETAPVSPEQPVTAGDTIVGKASMDDTTIGRSPTPETSLPPETTPTAEAPFAPPEVSVKPGPEASQPQVKAYKEALAEHERSVFSNTINELGGQSNETAASAGDLIELPYEEARNLFNTPDTFSLSREWLARAINANASGNIARPVEQLRAARGTPQSNGMEAAFDQWITTEYGEKISRVMLAHGEAGQRAHHYLMNLSQDILRGSEGLKGFDSRATLIGNLKAFFAPLIPRFQHQFYAKRHEVAQWLLRAGHEQGNQDLTDLAYQVEYLNIGGQERYQRREAAARRVTAPAKLAGWLLRFSWRAGKKVSERRQESVEKQRTAANAVAARRENERRQAELEEEQRQ